MKRIQSAILMSAMLGMLNSPGQGSGNQILPVETAEEKRKYAEREAKRLQNEWKQKRRKK